MTIKAIGLKKGQKEKIETELVRVKKLLPDYVEPDTYVEYSEKNEIFWAKVTFNYLGRFIKGEGVSQHAPELAVDEACDEVIRKIRKLKTSRFDKDKSSIREETAVKMADEEPTMADFESFGLNSDRITKEKEIDMKPITVDEAIDQMEALERDFFVFYDLDKNVTVVYRRNKNKGYGLLKA